MSVPPPVSVHENEKTWTAPVQRHRKHMPRLQQPQRGRGEEGPPPHRLTFNCPSCVTVLVGERRAAALPQAVLDHVMYFI